MSGREKVTDTQIDSDKNNIDKKGCQSLKGERMCGRN